MRRDAADWKLREAVPADAPRIGALFREMLRDICGRETGREWNAGNWFAENEDRVYVAEGPEGVFAFLSVEVHREERTYLYLDDFCVTAARRGCSVGNALLDAAEAYARSLGISAVLLHVERSNEGARRLYARRGFALLEEQGDRLLLLKTREK